MKTHPSLVLLLAACATLRAAPVASDDFDSPEVEASKDAVASALEWKTKNPNFTLQVDEDAGGLKSGRALRISMPAHFGGVFATFPEAALKPGQTLRVSLRFRFATPPSARTNGLRFGLFHNTSGDPADGSATGYWLMLNPGASANDAVVFFEAGTDEGMGGGHDLSVLGANAASFDAGTGVHTFVFSVTRGDSGVEISWQLDGEPQGREDGESRVTAFNGFSIAAGDLSQTELLVDDVSITLEP